VDTFTAERYSPNDRYDLRWAQPRLHSCISYIGCHSVVWCAVLQLSTPGDPELQKLVLATGRVSDESLIRPGYPIEFANGVDVALDGIVYFSCATDVLPYK